MTICGISNGILLLGKAGLLDNRMCTTNWQRVHTLKDDYPKAIVTKDVTYCEDDGVISSAGESSCFDVGLYIINKLGGGKIAYEISKRLVLYNVRKGDEEQLSVFLRYRNHVHSGVHKVQDYIFENISQEITLHKLTEIANMSERNFTRVFKKETGKTVKQFINELRVEKATKLLDNPDYSRVQNEIECGLKIERHLNRLLKENR